MPFDGGCLGIAFADVGSDMFAERVLVGNSLRQAHVRQDGQLDFGDIEPTAVLGGVVNLQPLRQASGRVRGEGFVERAQLVSIEVIAD